MAAIWRAIVGNQEADEANRRNAKYQTKLEEIEIKSKNDLEEANKKNEEIRQDLNRRIAEVNQKEVEMDEASIEGYARGNLPLSTISSLAGIFAAYSTYHSYSSILVENPQLIAAIVMIGLQSFFTFINVIVMIMMWNLKLEAYVLTFCLAMFIEVADFIFEIIIISLLSSVKAEYDKEYAGVLASVVQQSAQLFDNKESTDTQFAFTVVLCVISMAADVFEFVVAVKDLPGTDKSK